jgi:hypothetical protein
VTGEWKKTVLYSFVGGAEGANPSAGVISDSAGNLYGTTALGGLGRGTVFELTPGQNDTWIEKVLYSFSGGADGGSPSGGLVIDKAGNLYGTASGGGIGNCESVPCGTIFELSPGINNTWTFHLLYTFCSRVNCRDGGSPLGVTLDSHGNLYGTTQAGGVVPGWWQAAGCGTGYRLSPGKGGSWTFAVLHSFCPKSLCAGGAFPSSRLSFDSVGNLYGVTIVGGNANQGTAFKLSHVPGSLGLLVRCTPFARLPDVPMDSVLGAT